VSGIILRGPQSFVYSKNNEVEAVILAPAEYEYLMNLSELIEQYEINDVIVKRMKNYKRSKNVKWE